MKNARKYALSTGMLCKNVFTLIAFPIVELLRSIMAGIEDIMHLWVTRVNNCFHD